jgi:hypothetical protein
VIAVAAVVGALTGCTVPRHPLASASASSSAGPAGISCEQWLSTAALGKALKSSAKATVFSDDPVLASAGGGDCEYDFGAVFSDISPSVDLTVVPSAIVEHSQLEASLTSPMCWLNNNGQFSGQVDCAATFAVGGWWYDLAVSSYVSATTAKHRFSAIAAVAKHELSERSAPHRVSVAPEFDCAAAGAAVVPVSTGRDDADVTSVSDEVSIAAYLLAAPTTCVFMVDGSGAASSRKVEWDVEVYPNGTAAYQQCTHANGAASGSRIAVPGVASAFALPPDANDFFDEVCATDGKRTVIYDESISGDGDTIAKVWNAKTRTTLGSVLKPIFAVPAVAATTFAPTQADASAPLAVPHLGGGQCDQFLGPSVLAAALGAPKFVSELTGDPTLVSVGGLDCNWEFGTVGAGVTGNVDLTVVPLAIAESAEVKATLWPAGCQDGECSATVATRGWWYTLSMSGSDKPGVAQRSFTTITAELTSALGAATVPRRVRVIPHFDCAAAGNGFDVVSEGRQLETQNAQAEAAFLLAGPTTCGYTVDGTPWDLEVYAGGATPDFECDAGHQPPGYHHTAVPVPGVKSAIAITVDGDGISPELCATDGTTTIKVAWDDTTASGASSEWNAAALKTAGSLLVPVFAAAAKAAS